METLATVTFILGMILGSTMLGVATYVYYKRQVFPVGAIIMTVFGTLLLGLSIWQSAKIQIGADGNVTATFEKLKKEIQQNNQNFTQKIDNLRTVISTDTTTLSKLKTSEKIDQLIDNGQFEEAIKLDSTNVIPYMRLIDKLVNEGDYSKAVAYYKPLVRSNNSEVGFSSYPVLIFAFDQTGNNTQANNLIQQLRIHINDDIHKGYGYLCRSQQIGWINEGLQKYLSFYKENDVKKNVESLINELNSLISQLTT
jgi:hypothetical protein